MTQEHLKKVGGFNTEFGLGASKGGVLVGEETDLMERLIFNGLKPVYLPRAKISHYVPKEKVTLDHIASRYRAAGRYSGKKFSKRSGFEFFRFLIWNYQKILFYWLKFL